MAVGAVPDPDRKGPRRGVVMTANYEAREFGLRSAMPISQAYRLCPDCVYVPPNFDLYDRVSKQVFATVREFSDVVQQASIDEAYLDITERVIDEPSVTDYALRIKTAVGERHGISCSLGLGPNKIVAKIASDFQKPDGLTIVPPDMVTEFLAPLPVRKIPGVGPKTSQSLEEMGILTIAQLTEHREELREAWGAMGEWIFQAATGQDDSPVKPWEGPPESISNESTLGEDTNDAEALWREVSQLAAWLNERAVAEGYEFRTVGLKWRYSDFTTITRAKTLSSHTQDLPAMTNVLRELVDKLTGQERKVRLVGVRISTLREARGRQATLEAWS